MNNLKSSICLFPEFYTHRDWWWFTTFTAISIVNTKPANKRLSRFFFFCPVPFAFVFTFTSWYLMVLYYCWLRYGKAGRQQTPSLLTPRPGEQVVVWSHAANITTNNNNKIVTTIIRLFRVDINRVPIPNTIICEWWASDTSIAGHHLPFLLWNQRYSVVVVLVDSHRIYGVSNEQIHFLYIGYIPIYHKG